MEFVQQSKYSVPVMFQKLNEMDTSDGRYTKVRIWLMHTGENYNGSIFEQSVVDEAIPTLEYIPIVGFIEKNSLKEDDFSDHRYIIVRKDGDKVRKYAGTAYGVILSSEDNNAHYEERLCDDGEMRTFLVVDGIIWNMFDKSSEIINRDLIKSHSMELFEPSVEGFEDENNIFHFTKFSFRAACILGKDQESGMHNSTIEVQFTMNEFIKSVQSELSKKIETYTNFVKQDNNKGGTQMDKPDRNTDFALTVMQQFGEIDCILSAHEQYRDRWGDLRIRYSAVDIQGDEVICIDRAENYNYFAFKFTIDGDKPIIDFATKSRKKIEYTDFVESTQEIEGAFSFAKELDDFCKVADSKIDTATSEKAEAETNYSAIKTEYDEIKPKYDDFVRIQVENEKNAVDQKKNDCFTKFDEHLSDVADYTILKGNKENISSEDIEAKCAIMFTQKNLNNNFTKKQKNDDSLIADIIDYSKEDEGIVQTKYGAIKVRK